VCLAFGLVWAAGSVLAALLVGRFLRFGARNPDAPHRNVPD
jgi:hypothetical protein